MAEEYHVTQSSQEDKVYPLAFRLLSGVTLTGVTLAHTLPDGTAENDVTLDGSVSSPNAFVAVPVGLEIGRHLVSCVGNTSDTKFSPEILLIITVNR